MKAQKYGRRNVVGMIRQVDDLRKAIRREGTEAVQSAWDAVEEHIDYAYRADDAPDRLVELARKASAQLEKEVRARYGGMVTIMQKQFDDDMKLVMEIRRECEKYGAATARETSKPSA